MIGLAAIILLFFSLYRNADQNVSPRIEALFTAMENGTFAETYDTETCPELRQAATRDQYSTLGDGISVNLGALKSKTLTSFNMQQFNSDRIINASYNATFEKGKGTIQATLKKQNGEWKFLSFFVHSPNLLNAIATKKCPSCGAAYTATASFCPSCGVAVGGPAAVDSSANEEQEEQKALN